MKKDAGFSDVYVGVVAPGYPNRSQVLTAVKRSGCRRIWLAPLMMVAGIHFIEDLAEGDDAWKTGFEGAGFSVSLESQSLGYNRHVIAIFSRHIRNALSIIPH
jgi:sirohydrochlorin cobaltochelatase